MEPITLHQTKQVPVMRTSLLTGYPANMEIARQLLFLLGCGFVVFGLYLLNPAVSCIISGAGLAYGAYHGMANKI